MKKIFTLAAAALATTAYAAIDSAPASAQVETWYFNAEVFYPSEEIVNQEVQVAFDGNDIYFTGIYTPINSWVKGTLNNGVYEFPTGQDMGLLWGSYAMNFAGYDGDQPILATATLADGVLTFSTGIGILYTDYPDSAPAIWWLAGAKLSAEPQEHIEPVLTEETATVPYKNNFDSEAKRNQTAIYSPDGTGWDWGADWDTNNWFATCNNDGWTQADDYLIFPGLTLEAGKAYTVHFDAKSSSSSYWQNYEVLMATEAKLSQFTESLIPMSYCYSAEWENVEKEFEVAEAGTYFIAIHCTSYAYNGYFSVDNFVVEEVDLDKPQAAEGLSITPGRNGEHTATVNFTMPSANIGGQAYANDKMLDYSVTRGDIIVGQGSSKAGSLVFVNDEGIGLTNGNATYKVVISDGNHISREASASAYIGIDYPTETEYMEITVEGNQVTIAWVPVTKGANGGYVGAKYNVYACPARFQRGEKLNDEPLSECVFTFEYDVESGEQGEAWFCVTAVNEVDETYGAYESISVGAPYALPFAESFVDDSHIWYFGGDGGSAYMDRWGSFSSDADDAALCFYIWNWDVESSISQAATGKIAPAADAELSFDYQSDANATMRILVYTNSEDDAVNVTDEVLTFEAGSNGSIVIPNVFDAVADRSFVKVAFIVTIDASYQYLFMDNLKIEVVENPLGIQQLAGQGAAQIYSLDGKTINARPAAGLYIQNGEKMMIK